MARALERARRVRPCDDGANNATLGRRAAKLVRRVVKLSGMVAHLREDLWRQLNREADEMASRVAEDELDSISGLRKIRGQLADWAGQALRSQHSATQKLYEKYPLDRNRYYNYIPKSRKRLVVGGDPKSKRNLS